MGLGVNLLTWLKEKFNTKEEVTSMLSNKVDKVNGKSLISDSEITRLGGMETGANKYTHPTYTKRTGKPTGNTTPAFGGSVTVSQITSDESGHVTGATDRTITIPSTLASGSSNGLMKSGDFTKLSGVATGATKNSAGTGLSDSSGVLSVKYGTGTGTACQGNDSRLSDARTPTSHTHMLDDISITSALGANSDLNDLTNVGIYTCGATNSGTLANRPPFSGTFAMLIENKLYGANSIIQSVYVLMGASPLSFYRYLSSNGTWSSWTHMGGCSYTLPANSDLNDLKEFTTYACNTTNSKTLANKPFTGQIPCIIKNMPYNNVNYFIQFVYPLIDDNDLNDIYYRFYWNGTWLDWKKIITDVDMDAKADVEHNHVLDDINVTSALTANDDLNNYKEVGIYTCTKTNSGTLANKPYSNNYSCIIENKKYGSGSIVQFIYKVTTNATTCHDTYFRCYTANDWTDWVRIYTDKDFVVSDSLTDTSAKNALSAKQGKVLNDRLDEMQTVATGNITSFNSAYGASGQVSYIKYNGWVVINYYNLKMTSKPSGYPPLFTLSYKALKGIGNYYFMTKDNDGSFYPTTNIQNNVAYSGVLMYPTSD